MIHESAASAEGNTPPHEGAVWLNPDVRDVLDSVSDCFVALDCDYRIAFVNKAMAAWGGHGEQSFLEKDLWDLWPQMRGTVVESSFRRAFATGMPASFEYFDNVRNLRTLMRAQPSGAYLHVYSCTVEDQNDRVVARYRALSEVAASVVFTADPDGNLTELPLLRGVDESLAQSALGSGWLHAVHPADRTAAVEKWKESVRARRVYESEFRIRMADGSYRWHVARGVLLKDEQGNALEWIGACVDTHNQVTQAATLRLLDELTATTRELHDPEAIVARTQRLLGEYLAASRVAFAEAYEGGMSFSTFPNYCDKCEDLSGRFPVSGSQSEISKALRAGRVLLVHDVEAEMDEPTRSSYLAAGIGSVICVPLMKGGELVAMLGVHQTRRRHWAASEVELVQMVAERCWSELERSKAERALRLSEKRLRRILEAATVGVVVNDKEGKFIYANKPLLRMLNYSSQELHAGLISWKKIQDPDRLASDDLALEQLRNTGSCDPYETQLVRSDGTRIPVYVGAAFLPDDSEDGRLGAAFVTDLSELKKAEAQLLALNEDLDQRVRDRTAELIEANQEMEGFTYSVSHDLRAPLRAIVATSRILQEDFGQFLPLEAAPLLERQVNAGNRLGTLIDELLKLSRLARHSVQLHELDLSGLAREVAFEHQDENELVTIEIQEGLRAMGDPRLIRLLLSNLISNALRYSPKGGTVTVGQTLTERGKTFFVRGQGIGFDMQFVEKLFRPFERLVADADFPGTGVGLANVARIIAKHQGSVWAEGLTDHGSTFYFTLP